MSQYLIAVWDYASEGEFELSFKQGDRIKLLEKHNDDWWEGELKDEIGFFPVNRIRLESPEELAQQKQSNSNSDNDIKKNDSSGDNTNQQQQQDEPAIPPRPSNHPPTVTIATETITDSPTPLPTKDLRLPNGWEYAHDDDGIIYYFNESTGESRWDPPTNQQAISPLREDSVEPFLKGLKPDELQKLEFDQLQPEWIRHKGYVQMKMISEKKQDAGSKLSSWKVYYAVLSAGFLLLYKEGHVRSKKSSRSHVPVGSFDLESCHIDPAGKQDTKRKHVFIISTPKKVKLYIQTTSDSEFAAWLDAIMRELVARKENTNPDSEIMRLLKSLSIDENHMKVNRKMMGQQPEKGHWFTKNNTNNNNRNVKKVELKPTAYQQQQQLTAIGENDVFGGYLHMEQDGSIPRVVSLCIKEVEEKGLKSVGIYRLSGPASAIQKYRNSFNHDEPVSFENEHDINAVTGLLKLYFRELRNPLMTYEYYDWFIEAARIDDYEERMYQIKSIIHSLPRANYVVLECLVRHLNLVATYSDVNKMEASNLALIFSVGLLRSPQEDFSSIMMSDLQSKIMEAMIQQVDWFFEEDEEDLNEVVEQST